MIPNPHNGISTATAYVDYKSGEPRLIVASNPREAARGIEEASRLRNEYRTLDTSILGAAIQERTQNHDSLEMILVGIDELEAKWPGAIQTTTRLPDGTGIYTRDATFYTRKAAPLARLYGVGFETIHAFAVAHEYVHGQGVTDEREAHDGLFDSLVSSITRSTDPSERTRYAEMLKVQTGELKRRYGVTDEVLAQRAREAKQRTKDPEGNATPEPPPGYDVKTSERSQPRSTDEKIA